MQCGNIASRTNGAGCIYGIHMYHIYIRDLKTLKMLKDVGMACQKACKQGKDDIIVKVNLQSLIPASFSH